MFEKFRQLGEGAKEMEQKSPNQRAEEAVEDSHELVADIKNDHATRKEREEALQEAVKKYINAKARQ